MTTCNDSALKDEPCTLMQSMPREKEIASLEATLARLEADATRTAAREEPTTAHCTRKSYDQICEEIIRLKRRLKESNRSSTD